MKTELLVIGAGALGSWFLEVYMRSQNPTLTLLDGDTLERSNLERLPAFFKEGDIGRPKVAVAAEQFPDLTVFNTFLSDKNAEDFIPGKKLILDLADDLHLTKLIDSKCKKFGVPLLVAAVHRDQGMVYMLNHHERAAAFMDLFPGAIGDQQDQCDMSLVSKNTISLVVERVLQRTNEFMEGLNKSNDQVDVLDDQEWRSLTLKVRKQ